MKVTANCLLLVSALIVVCYSIHTVKADCYCECKETSDGIETRHKFSSQPSTPYSCADIKKRHPDAKSGKYRITSSKTNKLIEVYCTMDTLPGCGDGGWTRITSFDRSQAGASCPQGLQELVHDGKNTCTNSGKNCDKVEFTVGIKYTRVCGMVQGYRDSTVDGFRRRPQGVRPINEPYLDGVSITYSQPMKHLWSYVATRSDGNSINGCPCASSASKPHVPSYVGDHYYCERGTSQSLSNVLWDGKKCTTFEKQGCCSNPNQPWFYRVLPASTTDPIQLRICTDQEASNERVIVTQYEIYVQ